MIIFNTEIFDEIIEGTAGVETSSVYNKMLGDADWWMIFATATDVSGTSPTLKVYGEHSDDNQHWPTGFAYISENLVDGLVVAAIATTSQAFQRFRVVLGGTSPRCRLRLHITGRRLM